MADKDVSQEALEQVEKLTESERAHARIPLMFSGVIGGHFKQIFAVDQ